MIPRALLLTSLFALLPATAHAQLGGPVADPVRYSVILQHPASKPAQMQILANDNISDINVTLSHCAARTVNQRIPSLEKGSTYEFSWDQPKGQYSCSILMTGKDSNGINWTSKGNFQMTSLESLGINLELQGLSKDIHKLTFHTTHPVTRASVVVTAEDGSQIDSVVMELNPPKKDQKIEWKQSDKKPAIIELRVDDANGAWSTNTICSIDIPHEDIVFDTAKSNIRPDQESKLVDTLREIQATQAKYDRVMMQLYITGYTDTVGSVDSNDKLSRDRAKAIAAWIKKHGLNIDTYYRGLGERVLYTKTPDETPNESNRRVQYILTNVPPSDFTDIPAGQWRKI